MGVVICVLYKDMPLWEPRQTASLVKSAQIQTKKSVAPLTVSVWIEALRNCGLVSPASLYSGESCFGETICPPFSSKTCLHVGGNKVQKRPTMARPAPQRGDPKSTQQGLFLYMVPPSIHLEVDLVTGTQYFIQSGPLILNINMWVCAVHAWTYYA